MSTILAAHSYGESRIRLLKVSRIPDRHAFKDLTIGIHFEGEFESSFTAGDNRNILPGDTLKNTVYALAKVYSIEQIEEFAVSMAEHFLTGNSQIRRVHVDIAEHLWNRVSFGGKPHAYTFTPAGPERRTVVVAGTREAISIEAGVQDLILMKTSGAGFEGYRRDPFTTLPISGDQMLITAVTARWLYSENEIPFGPYWHGIREAMLETFIEHESLSPQQTLYVIAEAVLERYQDIVEINLEIPKRNCVLVDLSPFALQNENDVFVPVDEPHEIIRARVRRD